MYIQGSVGDEDWNCIHYVMLTSVLRDIIAVHIGKSTEKFDTIIFLCSVLGRNRKWRNITVHLYVWTVYYVS
jgi:hypothetical protein